MSRDFKVQLSWKNQHASDRWTGTIDTRQSLMIKRKTSIFVHNVCVSTHLSDLWNTHNPEVKLLFTSSWSFETWNPTLVLSVVLTFSPHSSKIATHPTLLKKIKENCITVLLDFLGVEITNPTSAIVNNNITWSSFNFNKSELMMQRCRF